MDSERIKGINKAKTLLEDEGYHIGNLWKVSDVCDRYDSSEEEAEEILTNAVDNEYISEIIFDLIDAEAERMNIKRLEDEH